MARKHIQQMSKLESAFIHGWLRSPKRQFTGSTHYEDRATSRHFTLAEALRAIQTGRVIEVHNDRAPSLRALVRDQQGTCAVVELDTERIITVYYNDPSDQHETLSWTPYRWTQDIAELVKGLVRQS